VNHARRSATRRARLVGSLLALAVLAAACGARVSDAQIRAAQGQAVGQARGAAAGGSPQGLDPGGGDGGTASPAIGASNAPGDAGAAPTATTAPAGEQASTGATPAGDNGGATDVGVTADQILLGNVSTLSGPVPGLFAGAVYGAQAAIAYQNSKGGIFGRKLKLDVRDDQFDTGLNRTLTIEELSKSFAFLNSFSLFDDAAVDQIGKSGIPDLSVPLNASRQNLANNMSVAPVATSGGPTGSFEWFSQKFPNAVGAVATLYGDVGAAKAQQARMKKVAEAVGWKFVYERGYQATETDFTADVVRMKQSGTKAVWLFATEEKTISRIARAMKQQNFQPQFAVSNYEPNTIESSGGAIDGWYGVGTQALFASGAEAALNPEVKLYQSWLQRVRPGARPDLFSVYGWAAGRLLFQAMQSVGPKLTRQAVIDAIRKIGMFSAGDLVAPANPGTKQMATCFVISQVQGGEYKRVDPARGFDCRGRFLRP
jgi:ABC-type branched-subunit amino acid transport system substrate-binding protein